MKRNPNTDERRGLIHCGGEEGERLRTWRLGFTTRFALGSMGQWEYLWVKVTYPSVL